MLWFRPSSSFNWKSITYYSGIKVINKIAKLAQLQSASKIIRHRHIIVNMQSIAVSLFWQYGALNES